MKQYKDMTLRMYEAALELRSQADRVPITQGGLMLGYVLRFTPVQHRIVGAIFTLTLYTTPPAWPCGNYKELYVTQNAKDMKQVITALHIVCTAKKEQCG